MHPKCTEKSVMFLEAITLGAPESFFSTLPPHISSFLKPPCNPGSPIKPPNPPEKPFDPPPNPPEKPLFMIIPPSVKKCLNNISEIRSYRLSIRYP